MVAHIDPEPPRAGLGLGQHRHGRVVDLQALGGEHMAAKFDENGIERGGTSADPIGERRAVDFDPFARERDALTVQRQMVTEQMVAELADQDDGEQARAGGSARSATGRIRQAF
jgi:hypothetical protein